MDGQIPKGNLLPALRELYLHMLHLPVLRPRSCHPSPIRCLRLHSYCLAQVADHYNCLPEVSLQSHPVKQPYLGAELPL